MLRIEDLHHRYGDLVALAGVSFDVPRGAMVGFVGRNGSGKTTTMRAVMGVLRPEAGRITWEGQPIDDDVRLRFGYLPEERGLYPRMRVRDQLVYLARMSGFDRVAARRSAAKWLERVGIDPTRTGDLVEQLSLGNQQRVQLAAALVHDPALLVLDEPFSGLDPIGVDVLADVLREQAGRGAAVVFSSHQLDLVERLCDTVVIIDAGRIVADGRARLREGDLRLRIEVSGAGDDWIDGLPGAEVLERDGDRWLLSLPDGSELDRVVDAARAAGSIRHLELAGRSLTERFREAVER